MNRDNLGKVIYPLIGTLLIFLVWDQYAVQFEISPVVLPRPGDVFVAIVDEFPQLLNEGWTTLLECVYGFALAVIIGIPIAVVMTDFRVLNMMFYPLLIATQSIPKVAIAPILMIWFGTGLESKLAIAFFIAFFPVVVDTATGLRATPNELLELARSLRCSYFQIFFKIRFPSALPFIFSGAKVAVTLAVIGSVIGEYLGGSDGLGALQLVANSQVNPELAWASLVGLSLLGIILYMAVVIAERVLMPWGYDAGHH